VDSRAIAFEESNTSQSRRYYASKFRRQMVELMQAGHSREALAREFEPTVSRSATGWRRRRAMVAEEIAACSIFANLRDHPWR